jgi:hypothetical protein
VAGAWIAEWSTLYDLNSGKISLTLFSPTNFIPSLRKNNQLTDFNAYSRNIINPTTKYVVFRAPNPPLIKVWLAGKSHNTEQGRA